MKKVSAIVVTYNGIKWIEECLASLYRATFLIDVIVIDNNSSDGTVDCIKSKFPNVILFEQKENLGFGKANNIGLSYALQNNADFVFLLNQDAVIQTDTISKLVYAAVENPEYGILSPVQLDYSGELLEYLFLIFMSNDSSRAFYSDFVLRKKNKAIYDIKFVQAAAWLLPISTLQKIGGFDPIFFHYGEDDNYCQRVLFHKMKIGVVPNAYIQHDSFMGMKPVPIPFSEKYFREYQKRLYVKYADLNVVFSNIDFKNEKIKIYKMFIMSIIKFDFYKIKGLCKQYKVLLDSLIQIENSRNTNLKIQSNYL